MKKVFAKNLGKILRTKDKEKTRNLRESVRYYVGSPPRFAKIAKIIATERRKRGRF